MVLRARRRLTAAFLAEALAAPLAALLLLAAAALAISRWTGRPDLPTGVLRAAALLAGLAVAARVLRGLPGTAEAALHLDRTLGAGERFSTVLETATTDPALAEWAARGALAKAGGGALGRSLAVRPPAALLPLLLAAVLAAGLALLPGAPAAAGAAAAGGGAGGPAAGAGPGGTATAGPGVVGTAPPRAGGPAAALPLPSPADTREALRLLEERARAAGNDAALRALASAREALDRGDAAAAREAALRAMEALGGGGPSASGGGVAVPGATGGGLPSAGPPDGAAKGGEAPFRAFPVPLRAREAVRRYFGDGK
jgi:hypothetical protein